MKKGLLAVLFLGFSVIALHAHNADLAKTSAKGLNKAVNVAVQQAAVEAEMEALAKADADWWGLYRAVNQTVKNELYQIYKENAAGTFSDDLMNIWIEFKDISNGECWQYYFVNTIQSIGSKISKISKKDENLAKKVVSALAKGSYRYRHNQYLYEYVIPCYVGPMSWSEALQVQKPETRQLHSAG